VEGAKKFPRAANSGPSSLPPGTRIPPSSTEAEESVLGGILLDNETINAALERLRPEDFYRASHRAIFEQ
jgi:replicative DNA helicase